MLILATLYNDRYVRFLYTTKGSGIGVDVKKVLLNCQIAKFPLFPRAPSSSSSRVRDCTKSEETTCHVCASDENALITRIMSKKLHDGLKEFAVTVPLSRNKDYSRKSRNIPAEVPTV